MKNKKNNNPEIQNDLLHRQKKHKVKQIAIASKPAKRGPKWPTYLEPLSDFMTMEHRFSPVIKPTQLSSEKPCNVYSSVQAFTMLKGPQLRHIII